MDLWHVFDMKTGKTFRKLRVRQSEERGLFLSTKMQLDKWACSSRFIAEK